MHAASPFRPSRWAILAALFLGLLVAGVVTLAFRVPYSASTLRARVIETLSERLDADVELADLQLNVVPRMRAVGTRLKIRHRARRDVPPLISVDTFTVDGDLRGLWHRHVSRVWLEGLEISIPPDDDDDDNRAVSTVGKSGPHLADGHQVVIDLVEAPDARLIILRRQVNKPARVWQLHRLRVESVSATTAMPFNATLTNAVPPGTIETTGVFGPWHRDDPGHTPTNGEFTFKDADLSVFKGISGILSSRGSYAGTLERIDVNGETDTPDFTVAVSGHPVPLKTKYHAVVDGTNGNTTLERIDATFLNTSLVAKGGVYEVNGVKGREVKLDVTMDKARLEDVMRLAVKTPRPPMTGGLRLQTKFNLPPGDKDVVEKLRLDGRFSIANGGFTNAEIQQKINEMSLRASGNFKPGPEPEKARTVSDESQPEADKGRESANEPAASAPPVGSDFEGRFLLGGGTLTLSTLAFDIPGAAVRLNGRYSLLHETLDFRGTLIMDAKVSQTVTGWKSWLLKIADPLFRRNGQTIVPIKITGARDKPSFGIEPGRIFKNDLE